MLDDASRHLVEEELRPCTCKGHFRFSAGPRCPLCNAMISEVLRDSIHYIETGTCFNGDKEQIWVSP